MTSDNTQMIEEIDMAKALELAREFRRELIESVEAEADDAEETEPQEKLLGLLQFRIKALTPPKMKESYFATCERDDEGHCLPKGESEASAGDEKKPKQVDPDAEFKVPESETLPDWPGISKPQGPPPPEIAEAVTATVAQATAPLATNSIVDTSKWAPHNSSAKWAANKIKLFEDLAKAKKWDELEKVKYVAATGKPNSYQKAVIKAYDQLKTAQAIAAPAKLDISKWKKVGGQLGSNPGEQMLDPATGKKYYVKYSKTPAHAANEVLAGKLYELAGAKVPTIDAVNTAKGTGVASEWLETAEFDHDSELQTVAAQENFGVHAWLANWDAVGLEFDNQANTANGMATVDVGGSMVYRAQGEPKEFGPKVDEWWSLRDKKFANNHKVFGGMTAEQLLTAAEKVVSVSDDAIDALVDKYGIEGKKDELKKVLKERKAFIGKWADDALEKLMDSGLSDDIPPSSLPTPADSGAVAEPVVEPEAQQAAPQAPQTPLAQIGGAFPPKPVVPPSTGHQGKFDKLHAAAMSGDVAKLQAIATNYGPKSNNYAKKAHQYKQALLAAMAGGAAMPAQATPEPAKETAPKEPKPKIDPSAFPEDPQFVGSNATWVAENKKVIAAMKQVAAAGYMDVLQNMASPSPKVQAYKNELVAALDKQLNPPKPAKPYDGCLNSLKKVFKGPNDAAKQNAKKVGSFLVTEEPGVPDVVEFPEVKYKAGGGNKISDAAEQARHDFALAEGAKKHPKFLDKVKSYTSSGYLKINDSLRDGTASKETIAFAKTIIEVAPGLKPGTSVRRGISLDAKELKQIEASVGKVLQEPGISSSGLGKGWLRSCNFRLTAAPGAKGLYVGHVSVSGLEAGGEMLLPPGSRYLIKKVTKDSGGRLIVDAILLATVPEQCC